MADAEKVVLFHLKKALERQPVGDIGAAHELEWILNEAANAAEHVFAATTNDDEPVLLTISANGEATVYRHRDLMVETISYGRLSDGVFSETSSLADTSDGNSGLAEVTYSNSALGPIGGVLRIDCRFSFYGEPDAVRSAFLPMTGSSPN